MFDSLLAQGSACRDAADAAANIVEQTDIATLTAAPNGATAPDVVAVFDHLLTGSQHHLAVSAADAVGAHARSAAFWARSFVSSRAK